MLSLALFAAAAGAAGTAGRPSFDCARASTAVERMICGSEALAARDRAVAYAYGIMRRYSGFTRSQVEWLARRDACPTAACVEAAYDARMQGLVTFDIGGARVFERADGHDAGDGHGTLRLIDLGGGWHLFTILVTFVHLGTNPETGLSNYVDSGGMVGVIRIAAGRGGWRGHGGCVLHLARTRTGWRVLQPDPCAGADEVMVSGLYRR